MSSMSKQAVSHVSCTVPAASCVTCSWRFLFDRVAAGFFLLLVYGRLLFSDGQRIKEMKLDVVCVNGRQSGFLECEVERTKTALTHEKRIRRLPFAVPLQCLGLPWIPVWLQLRKSEGLAADGDKDVQEPLLRHPAYGSGWTAAMVTVGYAASWLRTLLDAVPSADSVPIGTHSCKATLLSWAAKRGLPHGPRRLLGYHVAPKDSTMVIYSRDALADPLRQLVSLLQEVAANKFQPDLTRSGMMLAQASDYKAKDLPLRQLVSLLQEVAANKFQPDLTRSGMMLAQASDYKAKDLQTLRLSLTHRQRAHWMKKMAIRQMMRRPWTRWLVHGHHLVPGKMAFSSSGTKPPGICT